MLPLSLSTSHHLVSTKCAAYSARLRGPYKALCMFSHTSSSSRQHLRLSHNFFHVATEAQETSYSPRFTQLMSLKVRLSEVFFCTTSLLNSPTPNFAFHLNLVNFKGFIHLITQQLLTKHPQWATHRNKRKYSSTNSPGIDLFQSPFSHLLLM